MYKLLLIIVTLLLIGCKDTEQRVTSGGFRECPVVTVHFSPKGGVTQSIVEGIDSAEHNIYVQAFAFTSAPIAEALIKAKQRGLVVEAVLDRENLKNKNSVVKTLHENNIAVFIDSKHAIQHNKVIVIDKYKVYTGSFNLSKGAEEHNAENSIAISDSKIAELYVENWTLHRDHSRPYLSE